LTLLDRPRLEGVRGNTSRLTVHCGHGAAICLARLFFHGDAANHWWGQWNRGEQRRSQIERGRSSKYPKDHAMGFNRKRSPPDTTEYAYERSVTPLI
jgi:hypothetical protein